MIQLNGVIEELAPVTLRLYDDAELHHSRRFVRPGAAPLEVPAGHDLLLRVTAWTAPAGGPPPRNVYRLRLPLHLPAGDDWQPAVWPLDQLVPEAALSARGVLRWRPASIVHRLAAGWILECRRLALGGKWVATICSVCGQGISDERRQAVGSSLVRTCSPPCAAEHDRRRRAARKHEQRLRTTAPQGWGA